MVALARVGSSELSLNEFAAGVSRFKQHVCVPEEHRYLDSDYYTRLMSVWLWSSPERLLD